MENHIGKHMEMWKRTLCVVLAYMGSLERGHIGIMEKGLGSRVLSSLGPKGITSTMSRCL